MDCGQIRDDVFLVVLLGVVYGPKTGKVLIGRRENDPYIKALSWSFPGGRAGHNAGLEESLKESIKKKTGISVSVGKVIFAKTYPENRKILSIYYLCEPAEGSGDLAAAPIGKPKSGFVELKWVKPEEISDYFTTSYHPNLEKIIGYLKRGLNR